jgi:hypothetical protein
MADTYRPGDNYVICQISGFKVRASETRRRWDGLIVAKRFWEPRHPQDFVRGRFDDQRPQVSVPEAADVFLGANEVTAEDL